MSTMTHRHLDSQIDRLAIMRRSIKTLEQLHHDTKCSDVSRRLAAVRGELPYVENLISELSNKLAHPEA